MTRKSSVHFKDRQIVPPTLAALGGSSEEKMEMAGIMRKPVRWRPYEFLDRNTSARQHIESEAAAEYSRDYYDHPTFRAK